MRARKMRRMLGEAFHVAGVDIVFYIYAVFFIIMAILLLLLEPDIQTFGDSLWYCFAVATTVGFGDLAAVSLIGRVLTVILSVYSIAAVALFTAVITNFFIEVSKARASESVQAFMDDLEHLPELSKEELAGLSERIKKFRG